METYAIFTNYNMKYQNMPFLIIFKQGILWTDNIDKQNRIDEWHKDKSYLCWEFIRG